MKALAVDDDKELLGAMKDILERHGFSTDTADNAAEGVGMFEKNHYDLVLVDYKMPKHDGIWFMKNITLPRHTKALLVTSFVDRTVIKQMFSVGVCGYVIKPFDEDELLRHIEFHTSARPAEKCD